jgi:hypothetical protein
MRLKPLAGQSQIGRCREQTFTGGGQVPLIRASTNAQSPRRSFCARPIQTSHRRATLGCDDGLPNPRVVPVCLPRDEPQRLELVTCGLTIM